MVRFPGVEEDNNGRERSETETTLDPVPRESPNVTFLVDTTLV